MVRVLYEMGASNTEILLYEALWLLFTFGLPVITACVAAKKNRSPGWWYLFGLFLWIPATIIILCLKNAPFDEDETYTQIKNIPENKPSTVHIICGNCGHNGNYEGDCPNCGSSLKRYIYE